MPTLGVLKPMWDALTRNQHVLAELSSEDLALSNNPAVYVATPGTTLWYIWDDPRMTLDMIARYATLLGNSRMGGLPPDWPSTIIADDEHGDPFDTGVVDRPAVAAEAVSRTPSVVLSKDIVYVDDDVNRPQTTIDAQIGVPATIRAWEAVPAEWTPCEEPED